MAANTEILRHRRSPTRERFVGTGFAAFWLLWWSLFTLLFDVPMLLMTVRTLVAQSYPSVAGEITQSEVVRNPGSDGNSFHADVRFRYLVNGEEFTGQRLHFFSYHASNLEQTKPVVDSLPVGKRVQVFYNQSNPSDSALDRTLDGRPLLMALFAMPFNLVMVGGWSWVVRRVSGARSLPLRRDRDRWCILPTNGRPWLVAAIVACVLSIAAIFLIGLGGWGDRLNAMIATWTALLGMSGLAFWHTRSLVRREKPVLVLDDGLATVTWPASSKTPEFSLPRTELLGVEIEDSPQSDSSDDSTLDFSILLTFNNDEGQPTQRLVVKTPNGIEAAALADWLEDWIALKV